MPVRQGTSPVYNNITDVYIQIETRQAEVITKFPGGEFYKIADFARPCA